MSKVYLRAEMQAVGFEFWVLFALQSGLCQTFRGLTMVAEDKVNGKAICGE